jgi:hypothetical protein
MDVRIRTLPPLPGTVTHVLLDSWYAAKRLWKTARERDLGSARALAVPD